MYGLINSSLQNMIRKNFGDGTWDKIISESGVPLDSFLSMRSYDDEITYKLVGATSTVLNTPASECLRLFGHHWVLEVAGKSYGPLLDAAGNDMVEFLRNMNALHDRISGTFVEFVPPQFKVEEVTDGHYNIHYLSTREGLSPFVYGLLEGLAIRFNSELTILKQTDVPVENGEHTVFEVMVE